MIAVEALVASDVTVREFDAAYDERGVVLCRVPQFNES